MAEGGAYAAFPGEIAFAANASTGRALPVPTAVQRRWTDMKLAFQVYGVRDMCERDFASYAYLRPLLQQKTAGK